MMRSPLPLLVVGLVAGLILILVVTLPPRAAAPDATKVPTLSNAEALTIVAERMRSAAAAQQVSANGQAQFQDGAWTISVGDAQFSFTQRNRIVVPLNDAARVLEFSGSASTIPDS
jgi:hypothetical protein